MTEFPPQVLDLVSMAVDEDLGPGDITSDSTIDQAAQGEAIIVARQQLVCCGLGLIPVVFDRIGRGVFVNWLAKDGQVVERGDALAQLQGPMRILMAGERTVLNFLQRMSGVATLSRLYADKAAGRAVVLDSRKTIPGWRWLDKMSVRVGGCRNHRMGLYDRILIKDNHIAACGGISEAVRRACMNRPENCLVEVEIEGAGQLEEAITSGAHIVMLDNFTPPEVSSAVRMNGGRVRLEVSGRINLGNLDSYLDAGSFEYISVGELTHSAPSADIAMEVQEKSKG